MYDILHAYTDGSYQSKVPGVVGAGYVLLEPETNNIVYKASEYSMKPKLVVARNVGGEIMAALKAIDKAMEIGCKGLFIVHDYDGIGAWAAGDWKTNTQLTREYKKAVDEARNSIDIWFVHVDAHSGNEFNDMADKLARRGVENSIS